MTRVADATLLAVSAEALRSSQAGEMPGAMREAVGLFCHRILGHVRAGAEHRPALLAQAHGAWRDWLADARPLLRDDAEGDRLAGALDHGLRQDDEAAVAGAAQALCRYLGGRPDGCSGLLRRAALIEQSYRTAFLAAYNAMLGHDGMDTAGQGKGRLDEARLKGLEDWLRACFPAACGLTLGSVKALPGGFSKQTLLVDLSGEGLPVERLVIRMDSPDSPQETSTCDEYLVLAALHAAGVAVPRPLGLEPTGRVLGGTFMAMAFVAGSDIGDPLDVSPAVEEGIALDLARAMAGVHALPLTGLGERIPGLGQSPQERLLDDIAEYERHWHATGIASVALQLAFTWLRANIALADGPRALIHRDLGPHNLLAAGDRLAAIIDWEQAAAGTPAQDMADLYQFVAQFCDWNRFLEAYRQAGGRAVEGERLAYYTLWAFTWRMVNVLRAEAAFPPHGGDVRYAYAVTYFSARFQARLMEQLALMM